MLVKPNNERGLYDKKRHITHFKIPTEDAYSQTYNSTTYMPVNRDGSIGSYKPAISMSYYYDESGEFRKITI